MKPLRIISLFIVLITTSINLNGQYLSPGNNQQDCNASFSVILDSLSTAPYLYHFKDLSTGAFNKWTWDFGDGTTSQELNPSHQYAQSGTYPVCLTIEDQNNLSNCFDQACQDIITLKYFSVGGLVYAGEQPLNNPVNEGDTGIASLYRIVNSRITFVEDEYFYEYGYYWFGYLFPGDYMIKIGLTENSTHYKDYFTTYFSEAISWTKADILTVSGSDQFAADIHLEPVKSLAPGSGLIRGYVKFEQGNLYNMPPISKTNVILADKYHNPLVFTHPDGSGYFEFSEVPFDSYYISADATGKPSSTVNVSITENVPTVEGINLTVFGSNTNFIHEDPGQGISLLRIYPNPIMDNVHICLFTVISGPVGIKLTDVNGRDQYSTTIKLESGYNDISIPATNLPKGLYLLMLQPQGSYQPVTAKFVK